MQSSAYFAENCKGTFVVVRADPLGDTCNLFPNEHENKLKLRIFKDM